MEGDQAVERTPLLPGSLDPWTNARRGDLPGAFYEIYFQQSTTTKALFREQGWKYTTENWDDFFVPSVRRIQKIGISPVAPSRHLCR